MWIRRILIQIRNIGFTVYLLSGWIWVEDVPRGGELLRVRGSLPELRGRPHRAGQGQARAARRESRHQCKSVFLAVCLITWFLTDNRAMYFAVLRIRDVYPRSNFFPSRIRIFSIPDPHQSIWVLILPKKWFLSSRNRKYVLGCSSRIRILAFFASRIPIPGSRN